MSHRLVTRVSTLSCRLIERAAYLKETSVSEFLKDAALEKAINTIRTIEQFELTQESANEMYKHLSDPNETIELNGKSETKESNK